MIMSSISNNDWNILIDSMADVTTETYKHLHIDSEWILTQTVEVADKNWLHLDVRRYWLPLGLWVEWLQRIY
jgi:hypothetical protein